MYYSLSLLKNINLALISILINCTILLLYDLNVEYSTRQYAILYKTNEKQLFFKKQ